MNLKIIEKESMMEWLFEAEMQYYSNMISPSRGLDRALLRATKFYLMDEDKIRDLFSLSLPRGHGTTKCAPDDAFKLFLLERKIGYRRLSSWKTLLFSSDLDGLENDSIVLGLVKRIPNDRKSYFRRQKHIFLLNTNADNYLQILINLLEFSKTNDSMTLLVNYKLVYGNDASSDGIEISVSSDINLIEIVTHLQNYRKLNPYFFKSIIIPSTQWLAEGISYLPQTGLIGKKFISSISSSIYLAMRSPEFLRSRGQSEDLEAQLALLKRSLPQLLIKNKIDPLIFKDLFSQVSDSIQMAHVPSGRVEYREDSKWAAHRMQSRQVMGVAAAKDIHPAKRPINKNEAMAEPLISHPVKNEPRTDSSKDASAANEELKSQIASEIQKGKNHEPGKSNIKALDVEDILEFPDEGVSVKSDDLHRMELIIGSRPQFPCSKSRGANQGPSRPGEPSCLVRSSEPVDEELPAEERDDE